MSASSVAADMPISGPWVPQSIMTSVSSERDSEANESLEWPGEACDCPQCQCEALIDGENLKQRPYHDHD
ncbi:MAG: hypothetical protein V3W04_13835 [Gammaproteobacteria bacterium]